MIRNHLLHTKFEVLAKATLWYFVIQFYTYAPICDRTTLDSVVIATLKRYCKNNNEQDICKTINVLKVVMWSYIIVHTEYIVNFFAR